MHNISFYAIIYTLGVFFIDTINAIQYKCPNCNAELKFDPEIHGFSCEYCDSCFTDVEIKKIHAENEQINLKKNIIEQQEEFEAGTSVYQCQSCGARIICEKDNAALFCYYCHQPVILSGRLSGDYRPSKVIGFNFSKDMALERFKSWYAKRWFCPKDFKTEQQLEKMTGLYVPFWVADCKINATYKALAKKVRSWSSGSYRYTETKEYDVVREANIVVEGLPADGSSKIENALMEAIEPFNYDEAKDFSMSYLSGFYADKYDVDKQEMFPRIRIRANGASKNVINHSLKGYTSVIPSQQDYIIQKTTWQYMLLPVWFMTYKYKDKIYSFALNGQTGKIAGTPPLDNKKMTLFSLALGAGIGLIVTLGGFLLF